MADIPKSEINFIRKTPLFEGLHEAALTMLLEEAHLKPISRDGFYFHKDDPADKLYVLVHGRVKILQTTSEGHQVVLRIAEPGKMFGGIAAFDNTVYPASALALTDSKSYWWSSQTIADLIVTYPSVAQNALKHLSTNLLEVQDRYRELATERVEQRVARTLVRLVRQVGRKTNEGILIDMPLSRQDLAEMTGTTLYTVSRILSGWEQKNLVHAGRERVIITAPHALISIAEDFPSTS